MRKREIKIFASLMLSLVLFMSLVAPAAGAGGGHWAGETLSAWSDRGWLVGDGNGNLRPDDPVTRAEFASMANRSFGLGKLPGTGAFKDLSESDWAYADIRTAVAQGYLKGNGDGTVKPHQPITREEAAVMIARLLGLASGDAEVDFKDREEIAGWSLDAVAAVSREGIFRGLPDGTFRPRAVLTRAEAAVSLERALAASDLGTRYPKAGTYGPESGTEQIEGNVTVMAADVTLRNLHITGDLIIAASVGEGDVYLNGVTVDGTMIVRGGGENSVHLTDSVLVTVVVDKKTGAVRLMAQGKTVIREVELRSSSIVHAAGLSDDGGISVVKLSEQLPEHSRIELRGGFDQVNVAAKQVSIAVPEGSIGMLEVDRSAQDVDIELSQEAAVVEMILNAVVKVIGEGEVGKAVINAEGVAFDKAPKAIEVGEDLPEDAEIIIGGETKSAGEVQTPAQPVQPTPTAPVTPSNPSPGGGQPNLFVIVGTDIEADADMNFTLKGIELLVIGPAGDLPVESATQADGKWLVELDGTSYQVELFDESGQSLIPIELDYWNVGDSSFSFNLDYAFQDRKAFKVVLTPSEEGKDPVESRFELPNRPIIISTKDNDRSPGVDRRDFSVTWISSGREDLRLTRIFIVPAGTASPPEQWTPAEEFETVDQLNTWNGTEPALDSTGNPFAAGKTYSIYVFEYIGDELWFAGSDHESFKPVVDLHMDYNDPDLDLNHPVFQYMSNAYVTSDKSLPGDDAMAKYVTVGDVVYGMSDRDGYLYLLPLEYAMSPKISDMEAAVRNGLGLRATARKDEWVELNTQWMPTGQHALIMLNDDYEVSGFSYERLIELMADETEPLKLDYITDLGDRVYYHFNKLLLHDLDMTESLKSALTIRDEATKESFPLTADHEVMIIGPELILKLPEWVDKGKFSLILPAGALHDIHGNENKAQIDAGPYEFSPRLEIESVDMSSPMIYLELDATYTITANKDVHALYLVRSDLSNIPDILEQAAAEGTGLKLSLNRGEPDELSLAEFAPGLYKFVAVTEELSTKFLCFVMIT